MSRHSLGHLADGVLLRDLARLVATDRSTTASLLAHLAEVEARGLYGPRGYASMLLYCVGKLELSPDVAAKRLQAARAVRRFPALLDAIEDGRLHVSAVVLLAPHLTDENFSDLVAMAAHQSSSDIKTILAHRFPRPVLASSLPELGPNEPTNVMECTSSQDLNPVAPSDSRKEGQSVVPLSPAAGAALLAPIRFPLHASITAETREKLDYARDLLGHAVARGDIAEVLDRALDALIERLEKRRFAATARSRPARGSGKNERVIPAHLRREVSRRDGWSCTFVGDGGHRCGSRDQLQFDHVVPLARGGRTTVDNLRLLCRTHNQLVAERAFGVAFMRGKREQARRRAAEARAAAANAKLAEPARPTAVAETEQRLQLDVVAGLRNLGSRSGWSG